MAQRVQIKRGTDAGVPTSGMLAGEEHFATDTGALYVATDATTTVQVAPKLSGLTTLAAVATDDLMLLQDTSDGDTVPPKKITFAAFKTALNIPAGSSDEQVAVVSGGTSGYLWGTDGTDGVLRMGTSMQWVKDGGDGFVTLDVNIIDCGTF